MPPEAPGSPPAKKTSTYLIEAAVLHPESLCPAGVKQGCHWELGSCVEDIWLWEETWRKCLTDLHHGEHFAAWRNCCLTDPLWTSDQNHSVQHMGSHLMQATLSCVAAPNWRI
ncbi:uncharacterized protein PRD47_014707 isoform 1-T1 [Ara ararauna]